MTYRGLILDFGGVVTTDFYGALSAFCVREGLPPDAVVDALRDTNEGREGLAAVECGRISQRQWEITLGRLLGLDDQGLLGRALADLRPHPEVLDLVRRAKNADIAVGVLSNSWGSGDYDPYEGYDLDDRFDAVVISDQAGLRKPDPAIYLLTAAKIGVPPEACVFVDDTASNLPAARELGMATVHFTGTEEDMTEIGRLIGIS
ncbi:MAG TPA: HAD family phosphatase [Streptosporangiaceae bacterium]